MQDKRRRNDFASTEVGEATGGRVTQQAFDEKDSGISNAAMPGTRGDGRKEAQENTAPLIKGASLPSLPSGPSLVSGLGGKPGNCLVLSINIIHCGNEFRKSAPVRKAGEDKQQAGAGI